MFAFEASHVKREDLIRFYDPNTDRWDMVAAKNFSRTTIAEGEPLLFALMSVSDYSERTTYENKVKSARKGKKKCEDQSASSSTSKRLLLDAEEFNEEQDNSVARKRKRSFSRDTDVNPTEAKKTKRSPSIEF